MGQHKMLGPVCYAWYVCNACMLLLLLCTWQFEAGSCLPKLVQNGMSSMLHTALQDGQGAEQEM